MAKVSHPSITSYHFFQRDIIYVLQQQYKLQFNSFTGKLLILLILGGKQFNLAEIVKKTLFVRGMKDFKKSIKNV